MVKLTSKQRNSLPASDFAGPGRSYPVNDKNHAKFAKAMAAKHASPAERAKIDAKADKVLGHLMYSTHNAKGKPAAKVKRK